MHAGRCGSAGLGLHWHLDSEMWAGLTAVACLVMSTHAVNPPPVCAGSEPQHLLAAADAVLAVASTEPAGFQLAAGGFVSGGDAAWGAVYEQAAAQQWTEQGSRTQSGPLLPSLKQAVAQAELSQRLRWRLPQPKVPG